MSKGIATVLVAALLTVTCLPTPAAAQYGQGNQGVETGGGEIGRSMGGATGMAIGGIGGAALAAAVIKCAGIAAMGPLATMLTATAITGATIFLGSKVFSTLGQSLERTMGSKNLWTMLGAAIGAVACVAFLPATGIFLGPSGLILKAVIGGVAGGTLARLFSNQLEFLANPRILYPIMGGLMAAVGGMGIGGAVAGVAVGFVVGQIMDNVYAADRNRTLGSYTSQAMNTATSWTDKFKNWTSSIKNWISGKVGNVGQMANNAWDGDSSYQNYSDQGYNAGYQNAYQPNSYNGYAQSSGNINYTQSYNGQNLNTGLTQYKDNYQNFLNLNNSGAPIEQRQSALEATRQSYMNYNNSLPYGTSYGTGYDTGYGTGY